MHPMRQLIHLAEAPRKSQPVLSHDERVAQEQARQAQVLVQAKAQIAPLQIKAREVAAEAQRSEYDLRQWSQDWITEAKAAVQKMHKRYLDDAKEEFEYERENNPDVKLKPVNFYHSVTDGFAQWWDDKKERLDWSDGHHRLEDYFDSHPKTEQSDDMSRLQSEVEMLTAIRHRGGFGAADEMSRTLGFISQHLDTLSRNNDNGWSGFQFATTASAIITAGIPVILMFCKTIETLK